MPVGNFFAKVRGLLSGSPVSNTLFTHGPTDGIVHRGDNEYLPSPQSFAERSAVAQALQRLGYQSHRQDPTKHRLAVDEHTRVAAWLAHHHPNLSVVQKYKQAADQLGAPDVIKPEPDATKLGEWPEPPRNTYYTVPSQGPAGKDLTDAAIPLVRFVNTLLARAHNRPALKDIKIAPETKPAPEPTKEKDTKIPYTPVVKPATDEPPLKTADLRSFHKKNREEQERELRENPVLSIDDGSEPIPLVNYPGEIGRTGDRWADMEKLTKDGQPRVAIVRHLIHKYALSPQAAAAAYTRFAKAKLHLYRMKLARPNKADVAGPLVKKSLQGSRLAYHLNELINTYKDSRPRLAEWAKRALYDSSVRPWDTLIVPPPLVRDAADPHYNDAFAHLGDELKAFTSPHGTAVKGHDDPNEPAVRIGKAYNWHRIDQGLQHETHMRNWLKAHVKADHAGKFTDREVFERAEKLFDSNEELRNKYLNHARATYSQGGTAPTVDQLHNSLRRLVDKEREREELTGNYHNPKSANGLDTHHWKDALSWTNEAKHAKFHRTQDTPPPVPQPAERSNSASPHSPGTKTTKGT